MKPPLTLNPGQPLRWLAGLVLAALVLCGVFACGGGGIAGVGSGGTGLAEGSVSGFGSVIVEGVEYDNSQVTAQQSDASGVLRTATLKLGQRVRLVYGTQASGTAVAQSLQVMPQLIGPVSARLDKDGWMQVLGQWVRVVRTDDDLSRLGASVLSGYSNADSIGLGDEVLVHGAWTYDGSKAAYVLVATLIDKAGAQADLVQLGGVVQALAGGNGFRLNAANGLLVQASVLPAGLAAGQLVQVWAPRAAAAAAAGTGATLAASRVVIDTLSLSDLAGRQQVSVSGLATGYDPATRTVQVQGLRVKIDPAAPVDEAALAQGEFVSLQINPAASSATLVASSATVRGPAAGPTSGDLGATAVFKGTLSGINWNAASLQFSLRDTAISATSAVIDASCRSVGTAASVSVQVKGRLLAPGEVVTASQVLCSPAPAEPAKP